MNAPRFRFIEIALHERDVRLRLPFRFGVVTLTEAPQAFVRARIALEDGRESEGGAAELLAPKWFDKNLALSNEDNFDQLRRSLRLAAERYLAGATARTAFGHFAAHHRANVDAAAAQGLNPLIAAFGPALVDRAAIDALCRALRCSFYGAVRANLLDIGAEPITRDHGELDLAGFLRQLAPHDRIAARHTVGLVDPITAADQSAGGRAGDGLPETLEEVIAAYGHTWFKLKVSGDIARDIARLCSIAAVLDRLPEYRSTLDGNEQYDEVEAAVELWRKIAETPRLSRLARSVAFIEQPVNRTNALARDVRHLAALKPVIIDESDDSLEAFSAARDLGYAGVSSKTCKGVYKSILNAARCAKWNRDAGVFRFFMSGEDLTTQAGLAVQQDLALVALLGLTHVERNGHHYVDGFAGAPRGEQERFLTAHDDLYRRSDGRVRLRIERGALAIGSLEGPGFASDVLPDWSAMRPMPRPAPTNLSRQSRGAVQ